MVYEDKGEAPTVRGPPVASPIRKKATEAGGGGFIGRQHGTWQRNPKTHHAPKNTTLSRRATREWLGSHPTPHRAYRVLTKPWAGW